MRSEILQRIIKNSDKINLSHMHIADGEIKAIIKTIKRLTPKVSKIDLDNNNITDAGVSCLREEFLHFEDIAELSMQCNQIGKSGAIELFSLKKKFPHIDILFHGNKITDVAEMEEIVILALQ